MTCLRRRSSAGRSAIAGRTMAGCASRTCATARSERWAESRPAPTITPNGSPSCSRPGRRGTAPTRAGQALDGARDRHRRQFRFGIDAQPRRGRCAVPRGGRLWHGVAGDRRLRSRADRHPRRRLSRLRFDRDAAARQGGRLFAFSSKTYGGASLPTFRAALALRAAGFLGDREIPLSAGLASAYDAARAVWAKGESAPRRWPTTC